MLAAQFARRPMRARASFFVGAVVGGVVAGISFASVTVSASTVAQEAQQPQVAIERAVYALLDQFTARRAELEGDKRALFALVDEVAAPLFDFERIARLVLAQNWRRASAAQRAEFQDAFRQLLIATYATALHQYAGDERMTFTASEVTLRRGRKFARVSSEITLADGAAPIAVEYSMLQGKDGAWKIYNLTVGSLDLVINYRNAYAASVGARGLDDVIAEMRRVAADNFE